MSRNLGRNPIFFILRGFILSHNYFPDYDLRNHFRFVLLRFARLWPVHVLAFVSVFLLFPQVFSWSRVVEELAMIRCWFHPDNAWNVPAWSISVEWFAYLFLFPVAFFLFRYPGSWWLIAILVGVFFFLQGAWMNSISFFNRCNSIPFLFLAGAGLYRLKCVIKKFPFPEIWVLASLGCVAWVLLAGYVPSAGFIYAVFGLFVFSLSYEQGTIAKILSCNLLVFGGLASYSLYMLHWPLLMISNEFISHWNVAHCNTVVCALWILMYLIICLLVASLCYRYVEEPANWKLRGFIFGNETSRIRKGAVPG